MLSDILWVPSGRVCVTLQIVCDSMRDPTAFLHDPWRFTMRDPTVFLRDPSRFSMRDPTTLRVTLQICV